MAHGNISSTGRISGGGGEGSNHYLVRVQPSQYVSASTSYEYASAFEFIHTSPIYTREDLWYAIEHGDDIYNKNVIIVDGFHHRLYDDTYYKMMYLSTQDDTSPDEYVRHIYSAFCVTGNNALTSVYLGEIVYRKSDGVEISRTSYPTIINCVKI